MDPIDRQAAIDAFDCTDELIVGGEANARNVVNYINKVIDKIKDLPSAQPDIVACGDCMHWICHDRRCGYWNHGAKPLDWCCHAERRSNG